MSIPFILLLTVVVFLFYRAERPEKLNEVNEKYKTLREHLRETKNEKFHTLTQHTPITGKLWMKGSVGTNTNKGGEIVLCLDGKPNEIFHVLIHELAHCTLKEYSHSPEFWKNYEELRDICIDIGIYERVTEKTEFCGQHIQDK
jgi:predicted metal-dependent hydrolase